MAWPNDWDVFVSYRRTDAVLAGEVVTALGQRGLRVWFDDSQLGGGETFDDSIRDAIDTSTLTLCLISRFYQQSQNCLFEYQYATQRRRLPLRVETGLALMDEIARNRETVPEVSTVDEIVRRAVDKLDECVRTTRNNKVYLCCDREEAWERLKQPQAEGKNRLYLVTGDEFQAHQTLLERVRIFHELKDCQTSFVAWKGSYGPASQEYPDVLAQALAPRASPSSVVVASRRATDLLRARTNQLKLVLMHKSVPGDPNSTQDQHLIVRYFKWLSEQELGAHPLVCIQPIHWSEVATWNPLGFWRGWRSWRLAQALADNLRKVLKDWDIVDLRPLPKIGKKELRKYAAEHGYDVTDFVRLTYMGRSVNTLRAVQSYGSSLENGG